MSSVVEPQALGPLSAFYLASFVGALCALAVLKPLTFFFTALTSFGRSLEGVAAFVVGPREACEVVV